MLPVIPDVMELTRDQILDLISQLQLRVVIDIHRLEVETAEQAALYEAAARVYAQARKTLSQASERKDRIEATVELAVRKAPGNYGLDKVTETSVKAAVTVAPEVVGIRDAVIMAQEMVDITRGVQGALEQRRSMVSDAVSLYTHNYYASGQSVGHNGEGEKIERKLSPQEFELIRKRIQEKREGKEK